MLFLLWLAVACGAPSTAAPPTTDESSTGPVGPGDASTGTAASTTALDDTSAGSDDAHEPVCGDAIVDVPEECDLGPRNGGGEYCRADCRANACGDGYLGPGETCDDGNASNVDACTNACVPAACGDGIVQPPEACDEGRYNSPDGVCQLDCTPAICGDGVVQSGAESCDGAALRGLDCAAFGYEGGELACTRDCTSFDTSFCHACPNGFIEAGEQCDGADLAGQTCATLLGPTFGGTLECDVVDCTFDTTSCCQDDGNACSDDLECCSGWCATPGVCQPVPDPV